MNKFKIIVLLSYICIASISAAIITPALPLIQEVFALSHGILEWIVSIFLLGYVLGQLIYGPIANRYGSLNALRVGLIINLLGICISLFAIYLINFKLLLLGRFITALGSASGLVCTLLLINQLLKESQAKQAISFSLVSFTLGTGIAVFFGGILSQYIHWHYCFIVLILHGSAMLALTWYFPKPDMLAVPISITNILSRYRNSFHEKTTVVNAVIVGLVSTVAYGYSTMAPVYAREYLHLNPSNYGYWNCLNMLGMLGSGFCSARIMKKYGPNTLLRVAYLGIALCLIALFFMNFIATSSPLVFFTTTMLLYLFSGLIFPAASYFGLNSAADKATASSLLSFINMSTAMLAVIIMGYLPCNTLLSFTITVTAFYFIAVMLNSKSVQLRFNHSNAVP